MTPRPNAFSDVWRWITVCGPDECWPWHGAPTKGGYGRLSVRRRRYLAHRVAFMLWTGIDPGDLLVCHSCDNPPCCNPAHLFLGTVRDNNLDAQRKGRITPAIGSGHGLSKLTEDAVRAIRSRQAAGEKNATLAREFGVTPANIGYVVKRATWVHV